MSKKKRRNKSRSLFLRPWLLFIRLLTWPLAWLPVPLGLALGSALGRLTFLLAARRRHIAIHNIEMIKANGSLQPDLDAQDTARQSFANLGQAAWETFRFFHRGLEPFLQDCSVEDGLEHLEKVFEESRKSGRGVVVVTGHMGNWELMCHYLSSLAETKLSIVGRNTGRPFIDALVYKIRTSDGSSFIGKRNGAKAMLTALKNGGSLGTLIDQAVVGANDNSAAMIPFLGQAATTNLGPIRLARHSNAAILMVLFRREGRKNYVKIFPPMEPLNKDKISEDRLWQDALHLNNLLSEHIQKYPDQWMWGHRRWKTPLGLQGDPESLT